MSDVRDADVAVVELLRRDPSLSIAALAKKLGVTATAVRQRLERLMLGGLVERRADARPRGRPAHVYSLTSAGRRLGGDNFRDLAMVLWAELRNVQDPGVRQGLLGRIAGSLADAYRSRIAGESPASRLQSIAGVLGERDIACSVEDGPLAVLTTYSCPYPELAEQDRAVCATERLMLQELVGSAVQLSECRLDGASCCKFTAAPAPVSEAAAAGGRSAEDATP
jgi:predicted ArsR family transcriptional regulator